MQDKTNNNHPVINQLCAAIVDNDLALIKGMMNDKEIEIIDLFYIMVDPSKTNQETTPYRLAKQNDNPAILTYFKEKCKEWLTFKWTPVKTTLFQAIIEANLEIIRNLPSQKNWLKELDKKNNSFLFKYITEEKELYTSHKTGRYFYLTPYNLAYVTGGQFILNYFYNELISSHPAYFSRFIMAIVCHQPLKTLEKTKKSFFEAIPEDELRQITSPLFKALKTYNLPALICLLQDPKVHRCYQKEEEHSLEQIAKLYCSEISLSVLTKHKENKNKPTESVVLSKKRHSFFSQPFVYLKTCNQNHITPNK